MILDVEKQGRRVVTAQGTGTIVQVERDFISLNTYAVVRLDEDNSLQRFTENQLMFAYPQETKSENKNSLIKDCDVIKALECCQLSNTHQVEDCDNCPFNELPQTICQNLLAYHALQIIKRGTR